MKAPSCAAFHAAAIIVAVVVAIDEAAPAGEDVVESAAKELARIAQTTPRDSVQRASAMRANTA
jgi:hypothetical protein